MKLMCALVCVIIVSGIWIVEHPQSFVCLPSPPIANCSILDQSHMDGRVILGGTCDGDIVFYISRPENAASMETEEK